MGSISFFCTWASNFPSIICWKNCPFPTEWSWHAHQKSFDHICEGIFLYSINTVALQVWKSESMKPPTLFFFFKIVCYAGSLINFKMGFLFAKFLDLQSSSNISTLLFKFSSMVHHYHCFLANILKLLFFTLLSLLHTSSGTQLSAFPSPSAWTNALLNYYNSCYCWCCCHYDNSNS